MTVALITAIYDYYDSLKYVPRQVGEDVELICVTDNTALGSGFDDAWGWRVVYEPRRDVRPNLAAKRAKTCPWLYTDAPRSIWLDASFRVTSPDFVCDVIALADPIAQFTHPWRGCIYDEAEASVALPKYAEESILEQVAHYQMLGHPAGWGLWAGGVIAREHTPEVRELGAAWLNECEMFSIQDQLSEPLLLRALGLRPTALPGTHLENAWLTYEGSERHG